MNPFKGRHFQRDIILWAVRWYCKYGISYRELQEMLAERGVNVDHSTIYRWVQPVIQRELEIREERLIQEREHVLSLERERQPEIQERTLDGPSLGW